MGILFVVVSMFVSVVVSGAAVAQEEVTLRGEIVDLACFMSKGSRGPGHKACAQMCAKKGVPIGLLTESGDVLLLLDDHANPEPYAEAQKLAGENVTLSGKKYTKPGIAGIVVGSAERQ